MISEGAQERWFALQVRTRWENSTATLLSGKGFQTFLPSYKVSRLIRGNQKQISAPLFPGYVFCQFDAQNRLPVLITPGVMGVIGSGKIPIPVEDSEIEALQNVISFGLPVEPWPYLELGQRVQMKDPLWGGLEGILIHFKGTHRVVLSVSLLRRSVALEVERSSVFAAQATAGRLAGSLAAPAMLRRGIA